MTDRTDGSVGEPERPIGVRMSHMLVAFVAAILLPVLVLASALAVSIAHNAKETEVRRIAAVADALRNATDQMLASQLRTGWAVASAQSLQIGDLASFYQTAQRAAEYAGGHFILIDSSGQQLINTRLPDGSDLPQTANPAAAEEVRRTGEAAVGNIGIGAVAKEPLYAVRIPVRIGAEIRYVLSYVPEISASVRLFDQLYLPDGWFAAIMDGNGTIVARSQRHEDFVGRPIDDRHRAIMRDLPDYAESLDKEGRRVAVSARQSEMGSWGVVVGVPLTTLQAPVRAVLVQSGLLGISALLLSILAAYFGGRLLQRPSKELARAATKMGHGEEVQTGQFLLREANQIAAAMTEAQHQITERERALVKSEAHVKLAMREMSHRALNLLSVIQAVSKQTASSSSCMEEYSLRFGARLAGLAQSHRLLTDADWTEVSLGELAERQLDSFGNGTYHRISLSGDPIMLNPSAVQILGMAFHELGTNAIKHGALSESDGRIIVTWKIQAGGQNPTLDLRWEELSARVTNVQERSGFGSFLLSEAIAMQLNGTSATEWTEGKMTWHLQVPIASLQPVSALKFAV